MKHLIPLFRIDKIAKWQKSREKVWMDAEDHYEQLLGKMAKNNRHLVYLCSPLKPTEQKSIQDHVSQAILAASQILGGGNEMHWEKNCGFRSAPSFVQRLQ